MRRESITHLSDESPSEIFDGTYSFCSGCRKEDNCCVRVTPNGRISRPLLFQEDVKRIERHLGISRNEFSIGLDTLTFGTRVMKFDDTGCLFCRKGVCEIYPIRPFDCRLFPFDIMEKNNGALVWIVYITTCPVEFDIAICLEQAKSLLRQFKDNIYQYARADAPWMSGELYIELGPI